MDREEVEKLVRDHWERERSFKAQSKRDRDDSDDEDLASRGAKRARRSGQLDQTIPESQGKEEEVSVEDQEESEDELFGIDGTRFKSESPTATPAFLSKPDDFPLESFTSSQKPVDSSGDEKDAEDSDDADLEDTSQWMRPQWSPKKQRSPTRGVGLPVKRPSVTQRPQLSREELLRLVMRSLEPGERVVQGLRRLGSAEEQSHRFEKLVEAADELLGCGDVEVYEWSREDVEREIAKEIAEFGEWEYRWGEDEQVHGPFSEEEMETWRVQGFFSHPEFPIAVRNRRRQIPWTRFPSESLSHFRGD